MNQCFDYWTTLTNPYIEGKYRVVLCRCDCGTERVLHWKTLLEGRSRSCGCRPNAGNYRHGGRLHKLAEYNVWNEMRQRCNNPRDSGYVRYGACGIDVDPRWDDFGVFLADVGRRPTPKHTIERKDNELGYTPANCLWATRKVQARNQRRRKHYVLDGKSQLLCEWAEELGCDVRKLWSRIYQLGWSVERALTTPVRCDLFKDYKRDDVPEEEVVV